MDKDLQSIQESRRLVDAAYAAWKSFESFNEEQVERILRAVSEAGVANAARLAEIAVEETGFGNVADKTAKNLFGARDVYEAMRPLRTIGIVREDLENRILEVACPVGVIAGIVPSTNPTSTAIYKALIALKGRNAIVFSPHPAAVRCIGETVRVMSQAAEAAGAPSGILSALSMPTMKATDELMRHPRTALILATGGPGLVRARIQRRQTGVRCRPRQRTRVHRTIRRCEESRRRHPPRASALTTGRCVPRSRRSSPTTQFEIRFWPKCSRPGLSCAVAKTRHGWNE